MKEDEVVKTIRGCAVFPAIAKKQWNQIKENRRGALEIVSRIRDGKGPAK